MLSERPRLLFDYFIQLFAQVTNPPLDAIREGLRTMQQDENPGRCNLFELDDRSVIVDFAHNPAAMAALFDIARAIPAERRVLCFGQAGDRTDELIRELARDAWTIGLDRVVVSELPKYHRGREHGGDQQSRDARRQLGYDKKRKQGRRFGERRRVGVGLDDLQAHGHARGLGTGTW